MECNVFSVKCKLWCVKRAGCRTLLCLGVFGDALLFGFVVGVFCFFHHKQICMECIFVSIWKHLDFKTYVCIIIGDEYVPIRWILLFGYLGLCPFFEA